MVDLTLSLSGGHDRIFDSVSQGGMVDLTLSLKGMVDQLRFQGNCRFDSDS